LIFKNSYKKIEKIIIGFVSLIGISLLFKICIVHVDWAAAATGWVTPSFPKGTMPVIMSVLCAMLRPLLGNTAEIVFAIALLFSGLASCITAGMAGGTIFAGIYAEPYNISDIHTKLGVLITMIPVALLSNKIMLWIIGLIGTFLNIVLLVNYL